MKKFNPRSKKFSDLKLLDENFGDNLQISINLTISIYQIFLKAWSKYRVLKAISLNLYFHKLNKLLVALSRDQREEGACGITFPEKKHVNQKDRSIVRTTANVLISDTEYG